MKGEHSKSDSKQSMLSLELPGRDGAGRPTSGRSGDNKNSNGESEQQFENISFSLSNKKSNATSSLHKKTMRESARVQEDLLRV